MKNKKMLWIGLGVVAVVGYFWWMNKNKSASTTKMAMDTDAMPMDESADMGTDMGADATASNFADDELLNATGSTRQVKGRFP